MLKATFGCDVTDLTNIFIFCFSKSCLIKDLSLCPSLVLSHARTYTCTPVNDYFNDTRRRKLNFFMHLHVCGSDSGQTNIPACSFKVLREWMKSPSESRGWPCLSPPRMPRSPAFLSELWWIRPLTMGDVCR